MDGRRQRFLNIVDEYSRINVAIRVGRRCKAMDVIDAIKELLKTHPAPTHLRMDNGPEFIAYAPLPYCLGNELGYGIVPARLTMAEFIREVISAPLGFIYNRRFRDELLETQSSASHILNSSHPYCNQNISRVAQDRVQYIKNACGSPRAHTPGSSPAMEAGLITPPAFKGTGPLLGSRQLGR